jgi:hypothetical protein
MVKYYVYKSVCTKNQKFYIGVHKSSDIENDSYIGSGLLLRKCIKKHGKENFKRTILSEFDSKEDAFLLEKDLVSATMLNDPQCLNLSIGGDGGDGPNSFITHEMRLAIGKKSALKLKGRTKSSHEYLRVIAKKLSITITGRNKLNNIGKASQAKKLSGENNPMKLQENKNKLTGENNGRSVLSNSLRVELVKKFISDKYKRKELAKLYNVSLSLVYKLTSNPEEVFKKYGETYDSIGPHRKLDL